MPNSMEEMASKGMGKVKQAKATLKGLKGVFKVLAEEHGEVAALLKRVKASSKPEVRADLYPKIRKELLSHERGELSELYPRLQQHTETRAIAEEHDRDAGEMESLIEQLDGMSFDSDEWGRTFERLADAVETHAVTEENEYFPKAQEALGEQGAVDLEKRYKQKKQAVMQQIQ